MLHKQIPDTRPHGQKLATVDESGKKRMVYESGVGARVARYGSKESKSSSSEDDRKRQKRSVEPVPIQTKSQPQVIRKSSDDHYSR